MTKHQAMSGSGGHQSGRVYGTSNRFANIIIWLLVLFFTTLFTLLFIMCFIHFLKQAHGQIRSSEFDNPEATKTIYFLLSFYFFLWMLLYLGGSIFTLVRGQSLQVLQLPGRIVVYLVFLILLVFTVLLCLLDRLYHAWVWDFLSGIIFLYCVQASTTITSIVAVCSVVCSIDWCFPCKKLKALRRNYYNNHFNNNNNNNYYYSSYTGTGGSGVVTFLCHQGSSSSNSTTTTPNKRSATTVVSSANSTSHKTTLLLTESDEGRGGIKGGVDEADEILKIQQDLSRPGLTSFYNPSYFLAVSATDENGIPIVVLDKEKESVTQV